MVPARYRPARRYFFIAVLFLPPAIFLTAFFTAGSIIFVHRILFWYLFNISVLYDTSITQVT
ncbi:hypothetical protein B9086_013910 [Morganella morganii subsp. morganii]|nr:hypothetical protein D8758_13110 [Morganella morganii]RNW10901.1 hypothetical protein B9086_013910 [Morganella morganii subsp. morganii]OVF55903.1 hypothetical protein B5724_07920 [Morganella morganii]PHH07466.1 hypothetical protein CRX48_02515 [Morganella morganii]RAX28331.1 hypothetical protein DQ401_06055 [Morganella morganii]